MIGGQSAGAIQGTHQSTFRNPSAVYNANVGQDMGGLETGVNKNLAQTQESLNKSTSDYQSQLQNIDKDYTYKGLEDLQNINDTGTFSRLSSLVNPAGAQSRLSGVKSNTANYRPDTSGLAQSSTMGGLSSQLQNQYGTSAGGSRLDALLYRGGGNAGKAINQGLGQVNQFNQGQQATLGKESNLLSQLNQNAVDKSQRLKSEGEAYKGQLKAGASQQAQQAQSAYDAQRASGLADLQNIVKNTDYRTQLQNAIDEAFYEPGTVTPRQSYNKPAMVGNINSDGSLSPISQTQQRPSRQLVNSINIGQNPWRNPSDYSELLREKGFDPQYVKVLNEEQLMDADNHSQGYQVNVDVTNQLKNQLLNQFSGNIDMSQFDPSKFQGEAHTFSPDAYLDPRFNQIGQLLGSEQIAGTTNPSSQYSQDAAGLQSQISGYLNPQIQQARDAVNALFAKSEQGTPEDNKYRQMVQQIISNPIFQGSSIYGGGQLINTLQNTTDLLQKPMDTITSWF